MSPYMYRRVSTYLKLQVCTLESNGIARTSDQQQTATYSYKPTCTYRWGERRNERVITVGIGRVLLESATSGFSGYTKLAYCSSAKGLQ